MYKEENTSVERPNNALKEPQTLPHQKTQRLQMKHQRLFGRNERPEKENDTLRINGAKFAPESACHQPSRNQQHNGPLVSARCSSQSSKQSQAAPYLSSRSFE